MKLLNIETTSTTVDKQRFKFSLPLGLEKKVNTRKTFQFRIDIYCNKSIKYSNRGTYGEIF